MDVSERLERPRLTSPLVGVMVLMEDTLLAKSLVRLVILLSAKEGISEAWSVSLSHLEVVVLYIKRLRFAGVVIVTSLHEARATVAGCWLFHVSLPVLKVSTSPLLRLEMATPTSEVRLGF